MVHSAFISFIEATITTKHRYWFSFASRVSALFLTWVLPLQPRR
jgi:hypothetical protein